MSGRRVDYLLPGRQDLRVGLGGWVGGWVGRNWNCQLVLEIVCWGGGGVVVWKWCDTTTMPAYTYALLAPALPATHLSPPCLHLPMPALAFSVCLPTPNHCCAPALPAAAAAATACTPTAAMLCILVCALDLPAPPCPLPSCYIVRGRTWVLHWTDRTGVLVDLFYCSCMPPSSSAYHRIYMLLCLPPPTVALNYTLLCSP